MASAAEHPAAIRNVFITKEYNPRGVYKVRLPSSTRAYTLMTP